jgi:predicted PurR-regulated permease PerM
VLQPFVMGWAVRLHPVAVAVCVIAGTTLAGLAGAVVAVPLASIAWAVWGAVRATRVPESEGGPEFEGGPELEATQEFESSPHG